MNAPLRIALVATFLGVVLGAATAASPLQLSQIAAERLYAATTNGQPLGAAVSIKGGPPWTVQTLASTDGGRRLRQFGKQLYVVNDSAGTITRIPTSATGVPQIYDFGPTSEPQDIHAPIPQLSTQIAPMAYVTRRHDPFLHRLNLTTGQGIDVVDISPVGGGAEIALGTMERDGNRLFVQVRVFDSSDGPSQDTGVLAVVNLLTHTLIDVDPAAPGVQGVALQGAPPRLKMQIIQETRTLFVSTTDGILDSRGGIEMVNLDSLLSTGYALSEQQSADLGGFVMTKPDEGFFVFHTDLLASTHLMHFTIQNGPDPGPEIIVLLNDTVDVIAYNQVSRRIFLPSGFSSSPLGIYVFDAVTQQPVGSGPINTGMMPQDVIVAQ